MSRARRTVKIEIEVDAELVERAGRSGTDLSDAAEYGIRRAVGPADREERKRIWQEENAEAIQSSNEYVRKHGLPLAKYRLF